MLARAFACGHVIAHPVSCRSRVDLRQQELLHGLAVFKNFVFLFCKKDTLMSMEGRSLQGLFPLGAVLAHMS